MAPEDRLNSVLVLLDFTAGFDLWPDPYTKTGEPNRHYRDLLKLV